MSPTHVVHNVVHEEAVHRTSNASGPEALPRVMGCGSRIPGCGHRVQGFPLVLSVPPPPQSRDLPPPVLHAPAVSLTLSPTPPYPRTPPNIQPAHHHSSRARGSLRSIYNITYIYMYIYIYKQIYMYIHFQSVTRGIPLLRNVAPPTLQSRALTSPYM